MDPRPPELSHRRGSLKRINCARPHLVLAYVGGKRSPRPSTSGRFSHQVLRLDLGVGRRRVQRMLFFPGADLAPPGAARGGALFVGRHGVLYDQLVELAEDALHVAHDRHFRRADLADFGRVDVHVNHFGVRREGRQTSRHAIVEAYAEGDQQIAVGHRHVGGVAAVHAGHADEVGMVGWQGAEPHQSGDRRDVRQFHQLAQLGGRARRDDASARVNQRPVGLQDHLRGAADLARVALGENLISRQMNRRHRLVVSLPREDVFRDVDKHRAGPSRGGDIERLVDGLRQVFEALYQEIMLGARACNAESIGLLESIAANQFAGHLARDGHDGDGVHHGVHQAGGEVGRAGSRSGAADSRFAGGARVALGGEGGILFVAYQHVADVVLVERVVEGESDAAGVSEHTVDTLADQAFQKHRGAVHQR